MFRLFSSRPLAARQGVDRDGHSLPTIFAVTLVQEHGKELQTYTTSLCAFVRRATQSKSTLVPVFVYLVFIGCDKLDLLFRSTCAAAHSSAIVLRHGLSMVWLLSHNDNTKT